jgi:predicted enzyme related to lactoylglutathione lyase
MTALSSVNLFARDLAGLTSFYADLFDLPEQMELRSPIYRAIAIGDVLIGFNGYEAYGLLHLEAPAEPAGVKSLLTFEVADHASVARLTVLAAERGGQVVKPPYDTAYGSRQSVLRDPEGNVFRINAFTP